MNRASVFECHKRFKEGRESVRDDERCGRNKEVNRPELSFGLGFGLLCWGFKGVQEEIPREEASTLQIGSVAFPPGQCTSLQLHPCQRLFDQVEHQDSSSPSLQSRPCSLWLLVIPQAQRLLLWDNWGDERGFDEGYWHTHTSGLPWGLAEVVGTVQVHCSWRRLLRRGTRVSCVYYQLKCPYKKKSGNLFNDPSTWTFLFLYILE